MGKTKNHKLIPNSLINENVKSSVISQPQLQIKKTASIQSTSPTTKLKFENVATKGNFGITKNQPVVVGTVPTLATVGAKEVGTANPIKQTLDTSNINQLEIFCNLIQSQFNQLQNLKIQAGIKSVHKLDITGIKSFNLKQLLEVNKHLEEELQFVQEAKKKNQQTKLKLTPFRFSHIQIKSNNEEVNNPLEEELGVLNEVKKPFQQTKLKLTPFRFSHIQIKSNNGAVAITNTTTTSDAPYINGSLPKEIMHPDDERFNYSMVSPNLKELNDNLTLYSDVKLTGAVFKKPSDLNRRQFYQKVVPNSPKLNGRILGGSANIWACYFNSPSTTTVIKQQNSSTKATTKDQEINTLSIRSSVSGERKRNSTTFKSLSSPTGETLDIWASYWSALIPIHTTVYHSKNHPTSAFQKVISNDVSPNIWESYLIKNKENEPMPAKKIMIDVQTFTANQGLTYEQSKKILSARSFNNFGTFKNPQKNLDTRSFGVQTENYKVKIDKNLNPNKKFPSKIPVLSKSFSNEFKDIQLTEFEPIIWEQFWDFNPHNAEIEIKSKTRKPKSGKKQQSTPYMNYNDSTPYSMDISSEEFNITRNTIQSSEKNIQHHSYKNILDKVADSKKQQSWLEPTGVAVASAAVCAAVTSFVSSKLFG